MNVVKTIWKNKTISSANAFPIYFSLDKLPQSQLYVMMWWVLALSVVGNSEYWLLSHDCQLGILITHYQWSHSTTARLQPAKSLQTWRTVDQARSPGSSDWSSKMISWAQCWQHEHKKDNLSLLKVNSRSSKLIALVQSWQFELKVESLRCWLTAWPQIWQLELKVHSLSSKLTAWA